MAGRSRHISTMTIYLDLTREFNAGRLRTILCSGQAVVLLRLAIASAPT